MHKTPLFLGVMSISIKVYLKKTIPYQGRLNAAFFVSPRHCMRHLVVLVVEAWKKYRVLLNRVNTTTAPDIEWPEEPDTM